jgi:hypothetical protein
MTHQWVTAEIPTGRPAPAVPLALARGLLSYQSAPRPTRRLVSPPRELLVAQKSEVRHRKPEARGGLAAGLF